MPEDANITLEKKEFQSWNAQKMNIHFYRKRKNPNHRRLKHKMGNIKKEDFKNLQEKFIDFCIKK